MNVYLLLYICVWEVTRGELTDIKECANNTNKDLSDVKTSIKNSREDTEKIKELIENLTENVSKTGNVNGEKFKQMKEYYLMQLMKGSLANPEVQNMVRLYASCFCFILNP